MARTSLALLLGFALSGCGGDDDGGDRPGATDSAGRAAAKVSSCSLLSPTRFAVLDLPALGDDDIDCVLAAGDCAGVLSCFGFRIGDATCPTDDTCLDGDTLSTCRGLVPFEIDCAAWDGNGGPLCVTGDGDAGCGVGECAEIGETCDGSERQDCEDGILAVSDCDRFGLDCALVGEDAECWSVTGDSCSGPDRCEGSVAIHCEGEVQTETDCSGRVAGASCFLGGGSGTGDAYCGFGDECDPDLSEPVETCEGDSLRYCLLGAWVTVDCTELGFAGCTADSAGTGCR
jgi:hypothetical protein